GRLEGGEVGGSPGSHDQAGAEPPAGDDQTVVVGGGDAGAREARGAGVGAGLGPGGGARAVLGRRGLRVRGRGPGQPSWTGGATPGPGRLAEPESGPISGRGAVPGPSWSGKGCGCGCGAMVSLLGRR